MAKSKHKVSQCMPPLLPEELVPFKSEKSTYAGNACEKLVEAYFLGRGINVGETSVDDGQDILVRRDSTWQHAQVKKVTYRNKLDYGIRERTGRKVYRSVFYFNFQGSACNRQRTPKEIDYFYHVLYTPYRELIWEVPSSIVPLRENGEFISNKDVTLDRATTASKKAEIDFSKYLVHVRYDPIVYQKYPNFFSPKKSLLKTFIETETDEQSIT